MSSISTNPRGFTITDDELTTLLKTIDHLARSLTSTTAMFEESRDRGRDALLSAWRSWDGRVPFAAFARLCISRRMRGAMREYHRWAFPCAPSALPDADTLCALIARTMDDTREQSPRELAYDPPDTTGWLVRDLVRHWPCMSPTLQQALEDTLGDRSQADSATRDCVSEQTVTGRKHALLLFLRRHVVERETACWEEEQRWKKNFGERVLAPAVRVARKKIYDRARRLRRQHGGTVGLETGVAEAKPRVSAAH